MSAYMNNDNNLLGKGEGDREAGHWTWECVCYRPQKHTPLSLLFIHVRIYWKHNYDKNKLCL